MRKVAAVMLLGALATAFSGAAQAAKSAKPAVLFSDTKGDAGMNNEAIPGAEQGGFDLLEGTVAKKGKSLVFSVEHSAMPPSGTLPEGFRFLWHFDSSGKQYRLLAKSANVGKPDAGSQSGTERIGQVDAAGHFRIEECYTDTTLPVNLSVCKPISYLKGGFDPGKATFSIELPLKAIKAKAGKSAIAPSTMAVATTSGCAICWVPETAERSLTPYTIIDAATVSGTYKIPR